MNNFNYYNYYHNNYNVTAYRYNDIIFILIDYRIDNYKNQSCNLWPICVLDILINCWVIVWWNITRIKRDILEPLLALLLHSIVTYLHAQIHVQNTFSSNKFLCSRYSSQLHSWIKSPPTRSRLPRIFTYNTRHLVTMQH